MKLVNRNAAGHLFEKVKSLTHFHNSWRVIHINSAGEHANATLRNYILSTVTDLLADKDGTIYVCEAGDIFILFQGALKPILNRLSAQFEGLMPEQLWEQPEDDMFSIFDLSTFWDEFYAICRTKAFSEMSLVDAEENDLAYVTPRIRPAATVTD